MSRLFFLLLSLAVVAPARADKPFRFSEGKHGKGELKYVNDVPVLILAGKPEELGEQMGVLAVKPLAREALGLFKQVLKESGLEVLWPLAVKFGEQQLKMFPEDYRKEIDAIVKASGLDRELVVVGNTYTDLRYIGGCSGLMIDPRRSKTGEPIMGRNWDFPPLKGMHQYQMVIVVRPEGKKPFAMVSFPGSLTAGCSMTAINAAGLAIGGNEIRKSGDKAPQLELKNTPTPVLYRRIMEECDTLADVEKLVKANLPASRGMIVACDRQGGGVFEVTPKSMVLRRDDGGFTFGTNRFTSKELSAGEECWRSFMLGQAEKPEKLTVDDVARLMNTVCQKDWTAQTVVMEPKTLKVRVAFGDGKKSATEFPLKEIDLSKLLAR